MSRPPQQPDVVSAASVAAMSSPTRAEILIIDLSQVAPTPVARPLVRVVNTSEDKASQRDDQNQSERTHSDQARPPHPIRQHRVWVPGDYPD